MAWLDGRPVGSSELFLGTDSAGLHSLTVPDEYRGRGIGTALVEHTCREATRRGASKVALLASSEGPPLYERRGFLEVARLGYWYRSFQRR
jgi:predicted N-acetyltransferase YhbS